MTISELLQNKYIITDEFGNVQGTIIGPISRLRRAFEVTFISSAALYSSFDEVNEVLLEVNNNVRGKKYYKALITEVKGIKQ